MKAALIIASIALTSAFFAYMGLIVYQSTPEFDLSKVDLSISKAALFGDSFGVFSSLFSGAALIGLLYTIIQQREELKLQREEMSKSVSTQLRTIHISILQMAMEDECLAAVWESDTLTGSIHFKQKYYVNLILSNWEMLFDHDLLSAEQMEETLNTYMAKPYFKEFWRITREKREALSDKSDREKSKLFHKLAESAYEKSTA